MLIFYYIPDTYLVTLENNPFFLLREWGLLVFLVTNFLSAPAFKPMTLSLYDQIRDISEGILAHLQIG